MMLHLISSRVVFTEREPSEEHAPMVLRIATTVITVGGAVLEGACSRRWSRVQTGEKRVACAPNTVGPDNCKWSERRSIRTSDETKHNTTQAQHTGTHKHAANHYCTQGRQYVT